MKHGKLIVFEGVSGTGKETQAKLLQAALKKKGIISHIVFHPSAELKPKLRRAKTLRQQRTLLANDRHQRVQHMILPALSRGEWVISLRNYISAYVYQEDGKEVERVDVQPDILFLFDIDPKESMKRIIRRGEPRGMFETLELLNQKRRKYQDVLETIPHITIDASLTIDEIHKKVLKCSL